MHPKVMLFDEPANALAPEMIKEVLDAMIELAQESMTIVLTKWVLSVVWPTGCFSWTSGRLSKRTGLKNFLKAHNMSA
jgi:energy-coupling factor transporter ATP-binding protein EcfA2